MEGFSLRGVAGPGLGRLRLREKGARALGGTTSRSPRRQAAEADFDRLYRSEWPRAVTTALRFTRSRSRAEELAQEAFTRAFDRWRTVGAHPAPAAWVLRVVINLAIDDARRDARVRFTELEPQMESDGHPRHEDSTLTSIAVSDALAALPAKQREAITLRYLGGFEEAEIASALGVRPGTVKTHLKRGVARLHETLGPVAELERDPS